MEIELIKGNLVLKRVVTGLLLSLSILVLTAARALFIPARSYEPVDYTDAAALGVKILILIIGIILLLATLFQFLYFKTELILIKDRCLIFEDGTKFIDTEIERFSVELKVGLSQKVYRVNIHLKGKELKILHVLMSKQEKDTFIKIIGKEKFRIV